MSSSLDVELRGCVVNSWDPFEKYPAFSEAAVCTILRSRVQSARVPALRLSPACVALRLSDCRSPRACQYLTVALPGLSPTPQGTVPRVLLEAPLPLRCARTSYCTRTWARRPAPGLSWHPPFPRGALALAAACLCLSCSHASFQVSSPARAPKRTQPHDLGVCSQDSSTAGLECRRALLI